MNKISNAEDQPKPVSHLKTKSVKERPILFSGPMVRAILEGRKTQTRRIMKPQPAYEGISKMVFMGNPFSNSALNGTPAEGMNIQPEGKSWLHEDWCGNLVGSQGECPYGQIGDRLWVRETWVRATSKEGYGCIAYRVDGQARYALAENEGEGDWIGLMGKESPALLYPPKTWRPSIFMPRWACRIVLEITDVKVERLQDISEADSVSEGVDGVKSLSGLGYKAKVWRNYEDDDCSEWWADPRKSFHSLWDSINAKRGFGWKSNPWVWVITFNKIKL